MNYINTREHELREHLATQHPVIRPFEANELLYLLFLLSTFSSTSDLKALVPIRHRLERTPLEPVYWLGRYQSPTKLVCFSSVFLFQEATYILYEALFLHISLTNISEDEYIPATSIQDFKYTLFQCHFLYTRHGYNPHPYTRQTHSF